MSSQQIKFIHFSLLLNFINDSKLSNSLNPDPLIRHTFWTVSIGSLVHWTNIYGTNQTMVQRYLSIPTLKKAQKYKISLKFIDFQKTFNVLNV